MPKAITPYNFVPLPNTDEYLEAQELPSRNQYHNGRHTGWLAYDVETLTPTYTRAASFNDIPPTPSIRPGENVDFFHRGDFVPVLPGSSLRGMFRSVYEIMTYSRLQFLSAQTPFFRTFAEKRSDVGEEYKRQFQPNDTPGVPRLVGGIMHYRNEEWVLRVSNIPTSSAGDSRGFVGIRANDDSLNNKPDVMGTRHPDISRGKNRPDQYQFRTLRYYVAIGVTDIHLLQDDPSGGHYHQFPVFESELTDDVTAPLGELILTGKEVQSRTIYQIILRSDSKTGYTDFEIPNNVIRDYETWRDGAHSEPLRNAAAKGVYGKAPRNLIKDGEPAFAILVPGANTVQVIGANMMLHLRYDHSMQEVVSRGVPKHGIDLAQAVFGNVGERDATRNIKTRVYFEDAVYQRSKGRIWLTNSSNGVVITKPALLLGPKPTAVQAYLRQPDAHLGQNQYLMAIRHWNSPDAATRGFKRYWHRSDRAARENIVPAVIPAQQLDRDRAQDKLRTLMRPVEKGVVFRGRIRFENLTDVELGALYAAVQLPATMAHKFGMAKNLGLGSVRVSLDLANSVILKMTDRFKSLQIGVGMEEASTTVQRAYQIFQASLPTEHKGNLWQAPRLQALGVMLSCPSVVDDSNTRQISIEPGLKENPLRLVVVLRSRTDALAKDLYNLLPADAKEFIALWGLPDPAYELSRGALSDVIAAVLREVKLHDPETAGPRTKVINQKISNRTREAINLYRDGRLGSQLESLNWRILEECYPSEGSQWKQRWPLYNAVEVGGGEALRDIFPQPDGQSALDVSDDAVLVRPFTYKASAAERTTADAKSTDGSGLAAAFVRADVETGNDIPTPGPSYPQDGTAKKLRVEFLDRSNKGVRIRLPATSSVCLCSNCPPVAPSDWTDNHVRADVTFKNGQPVSAVWKSWK